MFVFRSTFNNLRSELKQLQNEYDDQAAKLMRRIDNKDRTIAGLEKQIANLEKHNLELRRQITEYQNMQNASKQGNNTNQKQKITATSRRNIEPLAIPPNNSRRPYNRRNIEPTTSYTDDFQTETNLASTIETVVVAAAASCSGSDSDTQKTTYSYCSSSQNTDYGSSGSYSNDSSGSCGGWGD